MTTDRISALIFLGVLFLVAVILRLDFLFVVFYLFALVYLLSHLWVRSAGRHLTVERRLTDHAFSGDQVQVQLLIANGGWLPVPWVDVHESLPVQLATPPFYRHAFTLRGHARKRLTYTLHCEERGYYEIGPMVVRTGDLVGFARPMTLQLGVQPLIVYPKVLPLLKLGLPTHSPQVALPARVPLFRDPSRVMGVRDYQRGDSPRHLHWTATAKASTVPSWTGASTMRLMVKQYQPAISRETLICLDLYREDYGRRNWSIATERAIVVAASLANHIVVRERLPVGLVTEAHDPRRPEDHGPATSRFSLPPRAGHGQLMRLLEVLACAQVASSSESGTGFAALLREAARDLPWGTTLAILTGRERPELLDTLFYLRRAGFAVSLILVQPGRAPVGSGVERLGVPGTLGVRTYRVWDESDLGSVLGRSQAMQVTGLPKVSPAGPESAVAQ